jgi:hypothetical protein
LGRCEACSPRCNDGGVRRGVLREEAVWVTRHSSFTQAVRRCRFAAGWSRRKTNQVATGAGSLRLTQHGRHHGADDERKDDVDGPTIERDARRVTRVVKDVHLIADRVCRLAVEPLPGGNFGGQPLPSGLIFNDRRPDPRAAPPRPRLKLIPPSRRMTVPRPCTHKRFMEKRRSSGESATSAMTQ